MAGQTFADSGTAAVHGSPNQAPVISSVTISPTSPTTGQTLTATVVASDPNGDAFTVAYQWLRNGIVITGQTAQTLNLATAGNGDRGDSITVRVTASDNLLSSPPTTSSAVVVANSLPTATVGLAPASPTTNQTLTATATRADGDNDTVLLTYVWRNGSTVVRTSAPTSALTDTLDLSIVGNGNKGDVITVTVTPADPVGSGTPATANVTVANSAPALASASITEATATTNTVLHVTLGATADADGDTVTSGYQWTKNGTLISGATGPTLDLSVAGNGDRGDVIRAVVTPNDGSVNGTAQTSSPLTVGDTAPTASVVLNTHAPDTNATLTATGTKSDVDAADSVTVTFVWKVNGAVRKTTANSSLLTDTFNLATAGNGDAGDTVTVEVTPSDGTLAGTLVSDTATVAPDLTPPGAPSGLGVTSMSPRAIVLGWTANSEADLAGYRVYRATSSGGPFTLLTSTLITTTTYTDTAAIGGTLFYRVTAVDASGNPSTPSAVSADRGIAFRAATTATGSGTSITITKPAGTATGDVLVAAIQTLNGGTPSLGGWTSAGSTTNGVLRDTILVHVVGASEPNQYVFTWTGSQGVAALLISYVGVDTTAPVVDAFSAGTGSTASITSPSVSPTAAKTLLITVAGILTNAAITPAGGMTEAAEVALSSGKSKADLEAADQRLSSAAATGTRVATAAKAAANIGQAIVLRVSGSAPPPPPDPTAPTAPLNLAATPSTGRVTLTWAHPTSDGGSAITNYVVLRGPTASNLTQLVVLGDVTTYQDNAVTNGTTYVYAVVARNGVGDSPRSNTVSVTPQAVTVPSAPRNLAATQAKPRGVALSWQAPNSNGGSAITGYQIYRSTSAGSEVFLVSVGNVTSYKDTSATSGVTYYYTVVAVNAAGASVPSNEAFAIAR